MECADTRIVAAFQKAMADLSAACERATDGVVAMGRAFDDMLRDAEESLTPEQRLKYYELRDQGLYPFDAIKRVSDWNEGDAVLQKFEDWE